MDKKDMLRHPEGSIYAKGYGVIAKQVMQDRRLSIEAKAIYAYLCSYAGAGESAFPSVKKMCYDMQIDIKRFYKHRKQLEEHGYIEVQHRRWRETMKKANNIYQLNNHVECLEEEQNPYTHIG